MVKRACFALQAVNADVEFFTKQKVFVKLPYVPNNLKANNKKVKVEMKIESESGSMFRCLLIPASFTTSTKIIDAPSKSSLIYPSFVDDFSTLDIYQLFHTFTYLRCRHFSQRSVQNCGKKKS